MDSWMFFILLGAVYLAPTLDSTTRLVLGSVATIASLIAFFLERVA